MTKDENRTITLRLEPGEEVVFQWQDVKGIIRKKIVSTFILTNCRVILNDNMIWFEELDSIQALNVRRVSTGGRRGMSYSMGGMRHYVAGTRGTSHSVGDLLFHSDSPGKNDIHFYGINDPVNWERQIKSFVKQRKASLDK